MLVVEDFPNVAKFSRFVEVRRMHSSPLRLPGYGFTDPSSRGPKLHLEWNRASLFGNKQQRAYT
jgi:hypothetical protein